MEYTDVAFDLTIFEGEGEGGGAVAGADGQAAGAQAGAENAQGGEDAERRAAFEEMLAANKDLYEERLKSQLDRRMRGANAEREQLRGNLSRYDALAQALGARYGVDPTDIGQLEQAVNGDQSWLEEQAARNGLTVEQQKHQNALEAENQRYKAAQKAAQDQANWNRRAAQLQAQIDETKQVYPQFDYDQELLNDDFVQMVKGNVPVRLAYQVVHQDELMSGAMQYAVQRTAGRVADSVRANGLRPTEGAGRGSAPAGVKTDISKLTREQCEELERRAMRGERVTFT